MTIDLMIESIYCNMTDAGFDNCSTAVCQNGGTCRHVLNDYYCDCPADVVGRVCDRSK